MPEVVDRSYVLHEKLGEGGMGSVYRAVRRTTGTTIALKLVGRRAGGGGSRLSNVEMRLALAREFEVLSSLHHPNIVRVEDYGFDDELGPYFTMELLDAPRDVIRAAAGRPLRERVDLLAQILRALVYVHRRGILHRDLKPTNILCLKDEVKVVDFGLAARPEAGLLGGTVSYMAPELLLGAQPSVQSDLFAVGTLAAEVLRAASAAEAHALGAASTLGSLDTETAPAGGVGPSDSYDDLGALADLVRRLRALRPTERPAGAAEALQILGDAIGETLPVETTATRESFLQASEFVGREAELATLRTALVEGAHGKGSSWLLGGESGVGKSRLAMELRTLALVQGTCVLHGQAVSEGGGTYHEWLPVLRALCLRAEVPDADAPVLRELIDDVGALLGREVGQARKLPPAPAQTRLLEAIEGLVRRHGRPTLLLLEDVHWASADSRLLLGRLARAARELPLVVVATYRDDEAPRLADELADLKLVPLGRLDRDAVVRLSGSMLGLTGTRPHLVDYLCRETEGNLFFLVEIMRTLAEQAGQLDRVADAELPEGVLTGGIQRLALRRVQRIPERLRDHLELAATAGRQLDLAVVRHAAGPDLQRFLVTCANAAVLESHGGDWRFTHDKLREAILADLAPERRVALHRRVGELLEAVFPGEARDPRSAALAHHFAQAGDAERAAHYHARAGDLATRVCAYGEARRHHAEALAGLAGLPQTDEVRRRRVDALLRQVYTTMVADSTEQNLQRMTEAAQLLHALGGPDGLGAEDRLRLARVNFVIGRVHLYRGQPREAIGSFEKVLPIAESSGDDELLALPSLLIGIALLTQGHMTRAEALLAQAIVPFERLGEPFEWFRAVGYHGFSLVALGRYREGLAELERVHVRAKEIEQPSLSSAAHLMRGTALSLSSDWERVLADSREVVRLATGTGDKLHLSLAWSNIGWASSCLGRHDEAIECRRKARELAQAMGGRLIMSDWHEAADAEIALNAGRIDEALALAEAVAGASRAADLPLSLGLAERVIGTALARKGACAEADARMQASVDALDGAGLVLPAARTRLWWAYDRRARGDDGASLLYQSAISQLAMCGCADTVADAIRRWIAA